MTEKKHLTSLEEVEEGVFVLTLHCSKNAKGHFENRFDMDLVEEIHQQLDMLLMSTDGPCALVVTCTSGNKFFSNGHDVQWLEDSAGKYGTGKGSPSAMFIEQFYHLMARFMTLPVLTVAAINGHAFAGGCLLAMAQDFRIMRADKGFLCMNEIDMQLMISPEQAEQSKIKPGAFEKADEKMTCLLQSKLTPVQVKNMFLLGKRYTGATALENGLIDKTGKDEQDTYEMAIKFAKELSKKGIERNRGTIQVLKTEMVRDKLPLLLGSATYAKL